MQQLNDFDPTRFITPEQAAPMLGLSEDAVRRLCKQGRIKGAMSLSGRWLIPSPPVRLAGPRKAKGRPPKGASS